MLLRSSWFRFAIGCFAFVLAASVQANAGAQSCHGPQVETPKEARTLGLRASLAVFAANYDVNDYAGHYEGVWATLAYRSDWWGADVMLPAYRLDHAQGIDYGVGDLMLTARGTFLRKWDGDLSMGVELPVMVPTGDWHRNLGMGEVMVMPDVYLAMKLRRMFLRALVGYGYMFGDMHMASEHVDHHRPGFRMMMSSPLVNPMNMSELEHALLLGVPLPHGFSAHARWWGAVPIESTMGVLRQAVAVGGTVALSRFDLTLELQRTITGSAFEWKPFLQVGANF